jgi:hypothetical protein
MNALTKRLFFTLLTSLFLSSNIYAQEALSNIYRQSLQTNIEGLNIDGNSNGESYTLDEEDPEPFPSMTSGGVGTWVDNSDESEKILAWDGDVNTMTDKFTAAYTNSYVYADIEQI